MMLSTGGNPAAQFVELLDPFDEPFRSIPYRLVVFDANGQRLGAHEFGASVIDNNVPMLVSTPAADAALGVEGDQALRVPLPLEAGQIAFTRGLMEQRIHTLTWGCINSRISSPVADPGPAPPDGQSAQRQPDGSVTLGAPTPKAPNGSGVRAAPCPAAGGQDTAAPEVRISRRALRLDRGGKVRVRLACPQAEASCAGTVRLEAAGAAPRGVRRGTRLGATTFEIGGGRTAGVKVRLSRRAERLARRARRMRVKIVVTARDAAGNQGRATAVVTLTARHR